MLNDQDMEFLKAAVLQACSRERIALTEELTQSATELKREHEQARRLIEDSRILMQRVRLIYPDTDEGSATSETPP